MSRFAVIAVILCCVVTLTHSASRHKTAEDAFKAAGVPNMGMVNDMFKDAKRQQPAGVVDAEEGEGGGEGGQRQRRMRKQVVKHDVLRRDVRRSVTCVESVDGRDATVCRAIGSPKMRRMDPFLMLDFFHVSPPGGFPDHPHRGFETVTYMLEGSFSHTDSMGSGSTIEAGDVQWLTAGSGVIHSEQPATDGVNTGMQLWVNLPRDKKWVDPSYQDIRAEDIPVGEPAEGVQARVICGSFAGVSGPASAHTPIILADVTIEPESEFEFEVPRTFGGFIHVIEGTAWFGENHKSSKGATIELQQTPSRPGSDPAGDFPDDTFIITTEAHSSVRVYIGLAEPIREPVAARGPFVMNSERELRQAFDDYRNGNLVQAASRHSEL